MIEKEVIKPDLGRATQGIPSLDSAKRFQHDSDLVSKDFHEKLDADRDEREQKSFTPDGDKPKNVLDISKGKQLKPEEFIRRLTALNGNLWFERSKAAPSEMGLYLKIPITVDTPEGLKYIGGFSAEKPLNERDWVHVIEKWVYTRTPGMLEKKKFQCHGCKECKAMGAIGGVIRGYRMLLKRLEDSQIITPNQTDKMFGSGGTKNWQARHGH